MKVLLSKCGIFATILLLTFAVSGCVAAKGSDGESSSSSDTPTPIASSLTVPSSSQSVSQETPKSSDPECNSLIESTPRGLACLHCTQPQARSQARALVDIMHHSCLKNIATTFLIDDTFSFDNFFLEEAIDRLASGGRTPFIYFYLSNGPSQRQWQSTRIDAYGVRISPEEFRSRIQTPGDPLRDGYRNMVARTVPIMQYAVSKGARVHAILQLEDNLSDSAFRAMSELAFEVIPSSLPISFGRNPCPGCYSGNGTGIPGGFFEDFHTAQPNVPISGGLVTNDGRTFTYNHQGGGRTLNDLRAVRDQANSQNNAFVLWKAEYQGLKSDGSLPLHPTDRTYVTPSPVMAEELILFLREGL